MADLLANNISHYYIECEKKHYVLNKLRLNIQKGEKVCIMGASGSGKSTLLHILSGLLKPKKGNILINNRVLKRKNSSKFRMQHVGLMFQKQHFFPELTILENVALPLRLLGKLDIHQKAEKMLTNMHLSKELYTRYPYQLSGGEQARAGLARALIHSPSIVFADEPTSALDDALTKAIFDDIDGLQKELGFSMVVATHDHALIPYFDQVYYLRNGELEA